MYSNPSNPFWWEDHFNWWDHGARKYIYSSARPLKFIINISCILPFILPSNSYKLMLKDKTEGQWVNQTRIGNHPLSV